MKTKSGRIPTYTPAHDGLPQGNLPKPLLPGIYWLRFDVPSDLKHVNAWLLEDAATSAWTTIDSGFKTPEAMAVWQSVLSGGFLAGQGLQEIFITHFHPDHFGLAGWLVEKTGITPRMTGGEQRMMRELTDPQSAQLLAQTYLPYYTAAGLDTDRMQQVLSRRTGYASAIHAPPEKIDTVHIDEQINLGGRDWHIVGGYGHSPEHACLYDADNKIFIAGDIVLPDITPNISFFPGHPPGHDPVADYLRTLDAVERDIPDDVIVLPSHGVPFRGLHRRLAEIRSHHDRRLQQLYNIVAAAGPDGLTATQAMEQLFAHRTLGTADVFFALGETLAHLIHDLHRGRLSRRTDMAGIDRYSIAKS